MKKLEKNIFILGMPRAGTTYLSKLLNNHSQIASSGETCFFGRLYIEPVNGVYTEEQVTYWLNKFKTIRLDNLSKAKRIHLNSSLNLEFDNLSAPYVPKLLFDALSNAFKKISSKPFFIEKTPHHIQYLNRILSFYPNAKFIVLIRDPYKWLLSYKFQGSQKNENIRTVFKDIYHPLFAALVWRKNFIATQRALKLHPEKCLVLKNEDLNNSNTKQNLYSFMNIDFEELALEQINSSFSKIKKPTLDSADIYWMNFIAKKYIMGSSYEYRSECINPFVFLKSIFQIIPSGISALKHVTANKNIFLYLIGYLKK